jgi:hypothetical protein
MVGERANAYYARHEDIVRPTIRESLMSEEEERNITFRETYRATLQRLGLIGPDQQGSDRITPLGRLLLEQINFYEQEPTE